MKHGMLCKYLRYDVYVQEHERYDAAYQPNDDDG